MKRHMQEGRGEEMIKKLKYIYSRITSQQAKQSARPFYKKATEALIEK